MSDELKAQVAALTERVHNLERRIGVNEGWMRKAITTLLGAGAGAFALYLKSKGVL